jgi:hypothetical protein
MENEDIVIVDELPEETLVQPAVEGITVEQEETAVQEIMITGVEQYESDAPASDQAVQQDVTVDNEIDGDASEQILLLRAINANIERLLESESETELVDESESEMETESETELMELLRNYDRALDSISDMTALTVDDLVYMIDQQNKIAKSQQMLLTAIMITCALCFGAICVLVLARYLHS